MSYTILTVILVIIASLCGFAVGSIRGFSLGYKTKELEKPVTQVTRKTYDEKVLCKEGYSFYVKTIVSGGCRVKPIDAYWRDNNSSEARFLSWENLIRLFDEEDPFYDFCKEQLDLQESKKLLEKELVS